jgi:hypothetical protein
MARRQANYWSADVLRPRYVEEKPFGTGSYVGQKRPKWKRPVNYNPKSLNKLIKYRLSLPGHKEYDEQGGAACLYGVPTRGVWQAAMSCMIAEGVPLGIAARLASAVYAQVWADGKERNWSAEQIVAEILNRSKEVAQKANIIMARGEKKVKPEYKLTMPKISGLTAQKVNQMNEDAKNIGLSDAFRVFLLTSENALSKGESLSRSQKKEYLRFFKEFQRLGGNAEEFRTFAEKYIPTFAKAR